MQGNGKYEDMEPRLRLALVPCLHIRCVLRASFALQPVAKQFLSGHYCKKNKCHVCCNVWCGVVREYYKNVPHTVDILLCGSWSSAMLSLYFLST